jgi:CubicO group peptidase (beta-lactamase class C family)
MLSHTSGMPDPQEYAWHRPETDEGALERYVRSLAGETLIAAPGEKHAYSNAAFEVLGDIIAKVSGQTFEDYVKTHILEPLAMHDSTFLRSEVAPDLATTPHFGMPPVTLPGAYPYHRAHAPSSTLHSSVVDMSRWAIANLRRGSVDGGQILRPSSYDLLWRPYVRTGDEGWNETVGLSWFSGTFRGRKVISHGGADPGFNAEFIMVPDEHIAVIVMSNANNPAVWTVADAVLDIVFGLEPQTPKPPVSVALGSTLATAGVEAAIDRYRQLQATQPDAYDFGADGFFTASWGAIEVRRAEAVMPLVNLWLAVQPEAPHAYEMLGWAQMNDGDLEPAAANLRRALALDPKNTHAAGLLKRMGSPRT